MRLPVFPLAIASCRKALKFAHPDIRFVFPMPHGKNDAEEEKQESAILEQLSKEPWTVIQFDRNASIWIEKVPRATGGAIPSLTVMSRLL